MNDAEKYLINLRGSRPVPQDPAIFTNIGLPANDGRPWLEQMYSGYCLLYMAVKQLEQAVYLVGAPGTNVVVPAAAVNPVVIGPRGGGGGDKGGSPPPPPFPLP
jgi:hypothetical protein